jgi:DNA-binding protein H-NS
MHEQWFKPGWGAVGWSFNEGKMARVNGRFSEKAVSEWFAVMDFDRQQAFLASLGEVHEKMRQVKIASLKRQLAVLEAPPVNGAAAVSNGRSKKKLTRRPKVAAKYRDPKTGETWSGRGRMARWLADKVKAGEKQDKYLVA